MTKPKLKRKIENYTFFTIIEIKLLKKNMGFITTQEFRK